MAPDITDGRALGGNLAPHSITSPTLLARANKAVE
jgi:hypothetical protein